jgi:hypothetical protein
MAIHSREQGLRVHHLTNLGGLVAIAGLDSQPPDLLLGALLKAAEELSMSDAAKRRELASQGHRKLDERAAAKRAFHSWTRAKDLQTLTLNRAQIARIVDALGVRAPSNRELVGVLSDALERIR